MPSTSLPWYRRTRRWGQTNITEIDPQHYDLDFWREHWKRTKVQGVIINAGGIVAYYPSRFPLQYRAQHLNDRDLFRDVAQAAREGGLTILARMDSNRADEPFYRAHADYFAIDAAGQPYRAQERYVACVNSPYYREYLPQVLREIVERYHPDGFTDNSWSGLGRGSICYCSHCTRKFREATGLELPRQADWENESYRRWIKWSYACRLEVWDVNNAVTRAAGGEDCLWVGMMNANPIGCSRAFRDLRGLGSRLQILMCDHQSRDRLNGFEQNALNGKLLHGVIGQDKIIPESMAMYTRGERPFRVGSNPANESRTWMIEGLAGGISPWWHHIGARHEDRRQYQTAEPVMRWHEANEQYLYDRRPVASVGILWSQENIDFYGREDADELIALPWRGITAALTRARIPYLPVHADQVEESADQLSTLILPDLGAMSDAQCAAVRRFVQKGGGLLATGRSSLFTEWGDRRDDFALADLFGAHAASGTQTSAPVAGQSWEVHTAHTYLRLVPELNQEPQGSRAILDVRSPLSRHPALRGFDLTDILPFGGKLETVTADPAAQVLATFVPPFPIYPPEFAWMRTPRTNAPGLIVRQPPSGGRVAYLAADLDRCHGRSFLPDHADLLANLVGWTAADRIPLSIKGPGYLDCHLYRQGPRLILHLVNLTHARAWPMYVEDALPAGPLEIVITEPREGDDVARPRRAELRVANQTIPVQSDARSIRVRVPSVLDHELVVIE